MKCTITVQLDEQVIDSVEAFAARRGISVSELVSAHLSRLAAEDADHEQTHND